MATDGGSEQATAGIWATGQMCDAVGSPKHAVTAPGSEPAQDMSPFRTDPPAAEVSPDRYDGRHTVRGKPGSHAEGSWESVSGRP